MKFRPKIDVGDYETKKGHVLRFLTKGARVKITLMFRGREMAHPEQGLNVLERLAEDLKPFATVESQPKLEGRNMLMLLAWPGFLFELQEGGIEIAKSDDTRINDEIRAPRVRLIGVDGSQLGLFDTRDAQRIADDQNLDLVEIAPNAEPPVCKVMDYGKFKYQLAMNAKLARMNQS